MLTLIILLSLITYRVTRFVIEDSLINAQRTWFLGKIIGKRPGRARVKIHDLFLCPYCLSVWIAAGATAIADAYVSVPLPVWTWLATCGGTMMVWRFVEA